MLNQKLIKSGLIAMFVLFASAGATNIWAHGGVAIEIDTCRIPVGDQWVHFTAYTPQQSADTEYCNDIPNMGYTNLVFDYEGRILTKLEVEFSITKEPEGREIYKQEPQIHKTGTINAVIDFSGPELGEGDYLTHVTIVHGDQKIDAHLPFNISSGGVGMTFDGTMIAMILLLAAMIGGGLFLMRKKEGEE